MRDAIRVSQEGGNLLLSGTVYTHDNNGNLSRYSNRSFLSSNDPHLQNGPKCQTFLVNMSFIYMSIRIISISKALLSASL